MSKVMNKIISEPQKCSGCRRCQLICSFQHTRTFNPNQAKIKIVEEEYGVITICFQDDCDQCGSCVKYCEFYALKLGGRNDYE